MPTHVYKCNTCGSQYEKEGSYKELSEYEPVCPVCLSDNYQRVYYPIGIVFKGNGFYKTDNGKEKE